MTPGEPQREPARGWVDAPISPFSYRPIFLIGYRATGKTTVARLLAERLGWNWLDADQLLEARHGRTIMEIFTDDGEPAFRDLEAQILEEVCCFRRHVLATGGGVVLRESNRRRLREAGTVVWLTADSARLWNRLRADSACGRTRPVLTVGGAAEVEQLLRAREPLYRACADLTVETSSRSPEGVVTAILAQIAAPRPVTNP
jgi:shikimate kinase